MSIISPLNFTDASLWAILAPRFVDRWSRTLDLKILLNTLPAVLRGNGAS